MVIDSIALQHNHFTKWIESSDLIWQFFLINFGLATIFQTEDRNPGNETAKQLERLGKVSDYSCNNLVVLAQEEKDK